MSNLQITDQSADISCDELKKLLAFDIGVNEGDIDFRVTDSQLSDIADFNGLDTETTTSLLGEFSANGSVHKFTISEYDMKGLLRKHIRQDFSDNILVFNYRKTEDGSGYDFASLSVGKKPTLEHYSDADDLLTGSLSKMFDIVSSIDLRPQGLEQMNETIDALEASIAQSRERMRKNNR